MKQEQVNQMNERLKQLIDSGKYELKWFDAGAITKRPSKAIYHKGFCMGVVFKHIGKESDVFEVVPYIPVVQSVIPPIVNYRCTSFPFAKDMLEKMIVDFLENMQTQLIQVS